MHVLIKVEGMSCQNCVKHVTEAIKNAQPVETVTIHLEDKTVMLTGTTPLNLEQLKNAIEEAGYDVSSITEV